MKYEEINIAKKLYGEENTVYEWVETEREIEIRIKSQTREGKCPKCGEESRSYHATCRRRVQSVPIGMKPTYIEIIAYKYKCENEKCEQKVFMEQLGLVNRRQVRTRELTNIILAVSVFMSNEGSSKVLGHMGIKVSNDTIRRIYERMEIVEEEEIEGVGIDEVALRKGQSYATAIYDLKDHHMVALLKGRDGETLREWLKKHRKIKVVARDRASAYAKAINDILPECMQVADRFHLLQNLIEKIGEIFKEEVPKEILIKEGEIMNILPEKKKELKVSPESKELEQYQYDNEIPRDNDGLPTEYDNRNHYLTSSEYKKNAENRKKNKS